MSHRPARPAAENTGGMRHKRVALSVPIAEGAAGRWRCLQSSMAVAVAPLRNLTGDADQQRLTDAFTDDLLTELVEHGRGFSLQRLTGPNYLLQQRRNGGARIQISCYRQRSAG